MPNLIKKTDDASYRARADRSIQSGLVVSVNRTDNTCILDVGMVNNNGVPVYMVDVPFSPQSPPHVNDVVPIMRTNSSPYSHTVGAGAAIGGANSGQVVGGSVHSIKKTGEADGQDGDITLDPGTDITITRAGKVFTFSLDTCTKTSTLFGVFSDLCARLDNIEALLASSTVSGGLYSYDFSAAANSMYLPLCL